MKNHTDDTRNWERLQANRATPQSDLKKLTIMDWLHQDLLFKAGLQVEADIVIPVRLQQNNLSVDYTE
ncbi:MAG TPA: hypothetical protein VFD75_00370 [Pyrinomonadaceae bacterium]|nr:hypothetical protein [Pyrinomonadaceae bacterium]